MEYNVTFRKKDKGIQTIISYKDNSGHWKQKSKQGFKTQKESKPWINKTLKEIEKKYLDKSKIIDAAYDEILLKDVFTLFMDHAKLHRTQNTLETYEIAFRKFYKLHDLKVSKIKKIHIQKCIDEFIEQDLKPSSIKTYVKKIKQVLLFYQDNYDNSYELPTNQIMYPATTKSNKKALSLDEVNDLLLDFKENHFQYYPFILLCVTCGLRRGEALGVTYKDINKKDGVILVNKQWKKLKDGSWGFGETKNRKHREVPISSNILKEIEFVKNNTSVVDINNRITTHSGMFISQSVNKYLKPYGITIHELRHTYITNLIASGVDFRTVADLVGDTVRMIYDTYSHVNNDMLKKATKIIENIF